MATKPTLNSKSEESKKPVKVFRSGQVKASIWENDFVLKDGTSRKTHTVTVIRSYKDVKTDEWKDTNSYPVDSLSDLESVCQESRRFLKLKEQ
jgi:hypothetical protein